MASRRFRLPNIEELSKEQERVRLLPERGCYLIVGGPGTGKSVVALLRALRHHRRSRQQEYTFLVFNRLLLQACREMAGSDINAAAWIGWFKGLFRRTLSSSCPVKDGKAFELDWEASAAAIAAAPHFSEQSAPFLIIDEGQDMPPRLYLALAELGFENFFVVADQNQQINEQNSTVREIAAALAIEPGQRFELVDNYRNSYQVARLAQEFCTGDPASPPVDLPPITRSARTPVLVEYGGGCRWGFDDIVERLLKAADRQPSRLIGVFTANDKTRDKYYRALTSAEVGLDHGRPRVVTYKRGLPAALHFSEGGIFVLNGQAAKGLEFDTVVLADIDQYWLPANDRSLIMRRFYVMVSRARERVILLRRADVECPVDAILPQDADILEQWRKT